MESAATMEAATCRRSVKTSAGIPAMEPATKSRMDAASVASTIPAITVAATVTVTAAIAIASSIPAITVAAAEPRTCPDKHAAYKVVRPIVPIGRAGIRIVAVVPISANRRSIRRIPITAHADANRHLCMRSRRGYCKRQSKDAEKCEIP